MPPIIKSNAITKYAIQLVAYICFNLNDVISLNKPLYIVHIPKAILIIAKTVPEKINIKIPAIINARPDVMSKFLNVKECSILYEDIILDMPINITIPAAIYVIIFATSDGFVINIIDRMIKHNEINIDSFPVFLISFSIDFTSNKIIPQVTCLSRRNC